MILEGFPFFISSLVKVPGNPLEPCTPIGVSFSSSANDSFLMLGRCCVSIELSPLPAIGFATELLPTRDGFKFTLTTLLSTLLSDAEQMFGPRDMSYTPVGIEFYGDRPQVWYPGTNKHISIILTDSAREDPAQAIFQLAHEVTHLLSPTGGSNAPVIEEGLSALFQQRANEVYKLNLHLVAVPYIKATQLANMLLKGQPNIIKQLRRVEPSFHKWTPRFLVSEAGISYELAEKLCEPFIDFEARIK